MQTIPALFQGYDSDSTKGDLRESFQRLERYIPYDLMRFRLTYEGPLLASSNGNKRSKEKWQIRRYFRPQLVPEKEDVKVEQLDEPLFPFYCLLENDSLITSFSVETDRLLTKPAYQPNQVYLVVEVNVRVMSITETNIGFLGE
jgi:hypothetical protein